MSPVLLMKKVPLDVLYLDKAFDRVSHERSMMKIEVHDIIGNVATLIKEWLTGRRVVNYYINGVSSMEVCKQWSSSRFGPWALTICNVHKLF